MSLWRYALAACVVALAGCNQQQNETDSEGSSSTTVVAPEITASAPAELPAVDASLLGAPNDAFTAIEPSEVGVFGAPAVMEALEPLLGPEVVEGADVSLTVRESGDEAIADVVRTGLQDDSVSGGHIRVEFRRESDGWYPTNAYRRTQCARGGEAGQWTAGLCP
ncbi:hypothetical protein [Candidatus Viadribacter manganicus]|uniref:Lipoprotein n=1 Tax=Candidatus Viadribacter manganicus TaxID=1759059 RepID=A0A1B1ACY7_9PROT|nr:hypothetical protein [Candidatus Viadribacter manganicus]ANP44420.1 hypothetical protein ATE48_00015 [Candidatus Viadribacter manganicus]